MSDPQPLDHSAETGCGSRGLFTDLYELTMAQAYARENLRGTAVFELFFRSLPPRHNYIMAAGLEMLLERLERLRFNDQDLDYLRSCKPHFSDDFLAELQQMRFTGDVDAVPEGTVMFPNEPLVRVTASLPQAQLIETLVLNQLHFPSLAATKGARNVTAAAGRKVVDFGSRRAHGREAAMAVARGAYLAGVAGTSLVEAGRAYGIPVFGTMAHSYIEAHDDELAAFTAFAEMYPETTLLVDTYDTLGGVEKVIELSRRQRDAFSVLAVRLDSGDLADLARQSRRMLDDAGLENVQIFASGGLDEYKLEKFVADEVPISGFGVGTSLAVSEDAPALDMAYKLVEYDGKGRMKLSSEKATYPGGKQVFRREREGRFSDDLLAPAGKDCPGRGLLQPILRDGRRLDSAPPTLEQSREYAAGQLDRLPESIRQFETAGTPYPVEIDADLESQRDQLREELQSSSRSSKVGES